MKYYDLDKEEAQILQDFEHGEFKSEAKKPPVIKKYQAFARATLNKTKNINIRLSEKTLLKLKAKAVKEGIPYQTLAASILHRFTNQEFTTS